MVSLNHNAVTSDGLFVVSQRMGRLIKQLELSGQRRDTQIRFGAREVGLKCVSLISGFRQPLERGGLFGCHWLDVI
jgi:hypothetical protein